MDCPDDIKTEIKSEPPDPDDAKPPETNFELQAEHFAFKWTPDGFKCPSCPFKTKIEGCLHNHIERKHPQVNFKREKILKCSHCEYQTECRTHFVSHVLRKHNPDPFFKCQECPYKVKSEKVFRKHQMKHGGFPKIFTCELCLFKTKTQKELRSHVIEVHEIYDSLECGKCGYKTRKKVELKEHLEKEHSEYQCAECEFTTKFKAGLTRHCYYRHTSFDRVTWLECEKCPYKAKSETILKVHVINEHMDKIDVMK